MAQRIDIKQFDMHNEKVSEPILLFIELGDNYLRYVAEYYGEQPKAEDGEDKSLGWEEMYQNFDIKIKREHLVSLDKNWIHKRQLWRVEVEATGYPNSLIWYFKKEKEAINLYKILDDFIFSTGCE